MRKILAIVVVVTYLVGLGAPAAARDITLEVENMALEDVIKLLEHASGFDIEIHGRNVGMPVGITVKTENEPFKKVLRQVCEQAGVHYRDWGQGFAIQDGPFKESPYSAQLDYMTIYVRAMTISGPKSNIRFDEMEPQSSFTEQHGRIDLRLDGYIDDFHRLIGIQDLRIEDAEGNVVPVEESSLKRLRLVGQYLGHSHSNTGQHQTNLQCDLPSARGGAVSLTGKLRSYRTSEVVDFRFDDLQTPNQKVTKNARTVTLERIDYNPDGSQIDLDIKPGTSVRNVMRRWGDEDDIKEIDTSRSALVLEFEGGRQESYFGPRWTGGNAHIGYSGGRPIVAVIFRTWRLQDPSMTEEFQIEDIILPDWPEPE